MNRIFFILLIFLCASQLLSQEILTITNKDLINKNALVFNFNGFDLNSIDGGIGWKKWTGENKVIGATLQIMASREQKDAGQELTGAEITQIDLQLAGSLEKRFPISNRLSPFIGGLWGLGYDKLIHKIKPSERLSWPFADSEYRSETRNTLFYCSTYFIVGVEYFFRNNVSLAGQYQIGGAYKFGEEKNISTVVEETRDISRINLGVWSSCLMLSIYL